MNEQEIAVKRLADINIEDLEKLLADFGLMLVLVSDHEPIPGSYWGEPEAGLIANQLFLRSDTPVHSALHEACHWICMDDARKQSVHTDAKGTVEEECAVNYLQILLAELLPQMGRRQMLYDMTTWGYSYREGDVRAWLQGDAVDAKEWLLQREIIDSGDKIKQP